MGRFCGVHISFLLLSFCACFACSATVGSKADDGHDELTALDVHDGFLSVFPAKRPVALTYKVTSASIKAGRMALNISLLFDVISTVSSSSQPATGICSSGDDREGDICGIVFPLGGLFVDDASDPQNDDAEKLVGHIEELSDEAIELANSEGDEGEDSSNLENAEVLDEIKDYLKRHDVTYQDQGNIRNAHEETEPVTASGASPVALKADNGGIWGKEPIPYVIMGNFAEKEKKNIETAFKYLEENTCVKFSVATDVSSARLLTVTARPSAGRCLTRFALPSPDSTLVTVELSPRSYCVQTRSVLHELTRALGLGRVHQRRDRKHHIRVRFENVHAFDQLKFRECIGGFDCLPTDDPYDCESVMHYSTDHFSYNGENTIEALNPEACKIPKFSDWIQREPFLTDTDIKIINDIFC